jgi:hypothetical protein
MIKNNNTKIALKISIVVAISKLVILATLKFKESNGDAPNPWNDEIATPKAIIAIPTVYNIYFLILSLLSNFKNSLNSP